MRRWLIALILIGSGCAPIPTWKRAGLMERGMVRHRGALEARYDVHVHTSRESMSGATGLGGPACGCN